MANTKNAGLFNQTIRAFIRNNLLTKGQQMEFVNDVLGPKEGRALANLARDEYKAVLRALGEVPEGEVQPA